MDNTTPHDALPAGLAMALANDPEGLDRFLALPPKGRQAPGRPGAEGPLQG
ncbi:MAG: hypothetical protein LUC30_06175 [Clostridiales bacterium]|nr:hypothetical protein [Clostridiales bacterium]